MVCWPVGRILHVSAVSHLICCEASRCLTTAMMGKQSNYVVSKSTSTLSAAMCSVRMEARHIGCICVHAAVFLGLRRLFNDF